MPAIDSPASAGIETPQPEPLAHRTRVLVLQHPQEQRQGLATAPLLVESLTHARRRVGLSWPSLKAAWGQPVREEDQAVGWAVLYLGARSETPTEAAPVLQLLDRKGGMIPNQAGARRGIGGIVLLDGTWAQAKTLWWRNPWLLKLSRIVLNPRRLSLYGPLRREPRAGALSTIEAAALAMAELERSPELEAQLLERFSGFLARMPPPAAPTHRSRPPHRRHRRPARSPRAS